jgi:hypothetical protein
MSTSSALARKYIIRGLNAPISGWSIPEKWFAATTAPPSSGMRSTP